ncbi:MAG: phage holin family protein [Clostridia bacterium]|nr:phage holin family protein [Clostridia bacterium]
MDTADISWLTTYLDAVVVGICIVIGLLVKHCTPLNNKYIPLIVALVGLIVSVWMHWQDGVTPHVILGGLFSGLASTGFHQVFKQLFFSDNT